MGRTKALLPYGSGTDDTFLTHIVRTLHEAGVEDVLVVGRPDDETLRDAVMRAAVAARYVANRDHERGQLSSVIAAINAVDRPGVRGVLIVPVDMPLVRPDTYRIVLRTSADHPHAIVRAAYGGRHGHPVVFDRGSFDALRHADPSLGAKAVLRERADRVLDVEVDDAGVLQDVDSVDDYVAIFGRRPDAPGSIVPS
jgi:CTP:molybdopterin cytidylyltransferase MocA